MNFEEHAAKPLLAAAGLVVPAGRLVDSPQAARVAAEELGPVMVKAQVPTGKRGKAGGVRAAADAAAAESAAAELLGSTIGGHTVSSVLVEQRLPIAAELYAAVLGDPASSGPLVMLSARGGMDVEEVAAAEPSAILEQPVDALSGLDRKTAAAFARRLRLGKAQTAAVADALVALYGAYVANDAELLEVNPLALLEGGGVAALDCKLVLDDAAIKRQSELAGLGTPEPRTELEARAQGEGLTFIELDGDVGVLANGAGVTMTTMDVVVAAGGRPANFLEIGGEAYTRGRQATDLVLDNPNVRSLVVNFCGAFARTDVMTRGVIEALEGRPNHVPAFFAIKGTGSEAAVRLLEQRLAQSPLATMDDAVAAAVAAAGGAVAAAVAAAGGAVAAAVAAAGGKEGRGGEEGKGRKGRKGRKGGP
jgi:succinyl-CoA synthetase beta subunit